MVDDPLRDMLLLFKYKELAKSLVSANKSHGWLLLTHSHSSNLGNWMISGSPVSQQALCWAVHSPPDHIHTQCSWREGEV